MMLASRFVLAGLSALTLIFALATGAAVQAEEAGRPELADIEHSCLNQKERRAEADTGKLVRLDAAMRATRARMPGTVVRARLCHGPDGLVYVLTVLAHDGKVARLAVDAVKGTLIGGL
jgi:uncharacterized membrane protein YkoI